MVFTLKQLNLASYLFMICSLLAQDLFIKCKGLVHYLFITCSWLLQNLFTTCSWHDLLITSFFHFHFLFITCSLLVDVLFKTCSWLTTLQRLHLVTTFKIWLIHNMFSSYSKFVPDFFLTCSWHVHNFFTNWSWLVYDLFKTSSMTFHYDFCNLNYFTCTSLLILLPSPTLLHLNYYRVLNLPKVINPIG